ncbi:MAG: trypsin-like peptidase domain-containing protein [Deltaproteobacteria bacterium]|nr:trypsin-like peptidase domain-containing protein [Deltaproteobacteria bacterium]
MRRRFPSLAAALVAGSPALLAAALLAAAPAPAAPPAPSSSLWTNPPARRTAVAIPSVAPLVDRLEPAVLVIFTEAPFTPEALPPSHPPIGPELPFDGEGPELRGQGAGFIVTATGYALTNHHVVENATSIAVRVGDSPDEVPATVVGSDEKTDIALIKLQSPRTDWPVIPLGDSELLKVGDFVVAIGSPFGLEQSVSIGIISGRSRRDIAPSGRAGLYDFLQTDAGINPGNSGGPLLNLYGEAIGINSAVNAAANGIGFAIPINMVKRLLPQLKDKGRFERSWIGVQITGLDLDVAKGLGLDRARGALVREVVPEGPAGKGGLLPGDVIVGFEGKAISDSYELPLLAGEAGVGAKVKLDVVREGKPAVVTILLEAHPDNAAKTVAVSAKEPEHDGSLGVSVVSLDADDRERLKLRTDVAGARVTKVRPGGPSFKAGLAPDDVIVRVGATDIRSAPDFAAAAAAARGGALMKLLVRRGAATMFVPLLVPARDANKPAATP